MRKVLIIRRRLIIMVMRKIIRQAINQIFSGNVNLIRKVLFPIKQKIIPRFPNTPQEIKNILYGSRRMTHTGKLNENGVHIRMPLNQEVRSQKPRGSKPSSSSEITKEEEMKFILLMSTSTTSLRDMNRKSTSSHTRG